MNSSLRKWLYGLVGGAVGGGASAGVSWLAMTGAHAGGMDVPILNFKALWVIFLSGMITNGLLYLRQSPLPPDDTDTLGASVMKLVPALEPKKDTTFITKPKPPNP